MASEREGQTVACDTLDQLLNEEHPTVLKVDVEGFELPMLRGASAVLSDARLNAAVLELKNHGARYGFHENEVRATMEAQGFSPFSYDPMRRRLIPFNECRRPPPNTIFLRDPFCCRREAPVVTCAACDLGPADLTLVLCSAT